jgi:hypothetical protein
MEVENTLAYSNATTIIAAKSFIVQTSGDTLANVRLGCKGFSENTLGYFSKA